MSEERESAEAEAALAGADPVALALALGAASRDKAEAYLEKQGRLAALMAENLEREEPFQLSHLRWRRFEDQMKGATRILLVGLGVLLVIGLGATLWNACQAEGIVVDAFSVPPSFAQAGIGGDVVADDVTGKIAAIRDFGNANSLSRSQNVRQERDQEIKVEIPETGISLAQAWRYLRGWLGRERHLSGNLRNLENGRIALTVSLDGEPFMLEGPRSDLDVLEQQAAEHVFAQVDPTNIVWFLNGHGRYTEALAAAGRVVELAADAPRARRAGSYALWAAATRATQGDLDLSLRRAWIGIGIDPTVVTPHREVMLDSRDLGHDEEALHQAHVLKGMRQRDQSASFSARGFAGVLENADYLRASLTGDFGQVMSMSCIATCTAASLRLRQAEFAARLHDRARARALIGEAQAMASDDVALARARYFVAMEAGDWRAAAPAAGFYEAEIRRNTSPQLTAAMAQTQVRPRRAIALALGGDFAGAHRTIDATRADCYLCLRMRGNIDALEKNWGAAAAWFARAAAAAPSIPFVYEDWGRMLLARGGAAEAEAKFAMANAKGPHFADPLEGWGEALMAKNQSHKALAKFAEAEKYAPNWGRLHLKWGEALAYAGKLAEARAQFARAAWLDLTLSEKSELAGQHHD